jgi:predicted DNA-binding protein
MKPERKTYNTTLNIDLLKKLKILSVETDKRANDLLEEAIEDLLKKYAKKGREGK